MESNKSINLFLDTRKLTHQKENHLTEFIAGALTISKQFRTDYAKLVLNEYSNSKGWNVPKIVQVTTQVSFEDYSNRPDMMLLLKDGHKIIIEHKIESQETSNTIKDNREQLRRYLDLPVDGLVYFRADFGKIAKDVLSNPKYIKPTNCNHFLWRDLYKILAINNDKFVVWLRDAFLYLGFTPPQQIIGDLNSINKKERNKNRKNFAKFWTPLISFCQQRHWKIEKGSIVELYISISNNKLVSSVFISPTNSQRFLIRFTPKAKKMIPSLYDKLLSSSVNSNDKSELVINSIVRKNSNIDVIDVKSSFANIIELETENYQEIETKLFNHVSKYLSVIYLHG